MREVALLHRRRAADRFLEAGREYAERGRRFDYLYPRAGDVAPTAGLLQVSPVDADNLLFVRFLRLVATDSSQRGGDDK